MKKLFFGLITGMLLFTGCSDDDPEPAPSAEKYMSITAGSSWNYNYVDDLDPLNNGSYTVTSTNRDSTAAGKSYHVFTNSDGYNEYYNISGSDYYTLQAFSLGTTDTTLENLYMKDNAATGTTWSQNYALDLGLSTAIQLVVSNKIQEKGIDKTVNGTAYSNVIHVITTLSSPSLVLIPGSSLTTDIHYYYAPKVGMIQNDAQIDITVPGVIDEHTKTHSTLTSATIL